MPSENPYRSPSAERTLAGKEKGTPLTLRRIAVVQKAIIVCILGQFLLFALALTLPAGFRDILSMFADLRAQAGHGDDD